MIHALRRSMGAFFAIAVVATIANLAIWWAGVTPATVWLLVVRGTIGNTYGLAETMARATPLALTGVSVAFALRAGLFNLGAEGQLAVGILAAALVGARLSPSLPPIWAVSVTLVAAATAGAALGALPGWLRGRFGAHEVVTTLMLNGLIAVLSTWLYGGPLRVGEQIHTRAVVAAARIPMLGTHFVWFRGSALSLAVLLAIAAPFCAELLLKRTSIGLRVRAVGSNPTAARAVGVSVPRTYAGAMAIAGAFAGLAGVHYVLGSKGYAEDGMGAGVGLAGIAVALLAGRHPVGILFAALLLATLSVGGLVVNALVPADILAVVQALILVAVASFAASRATGMERTT